MSKMGKIVICEVTGFVGEVRAEVQYATGNNQSLVQPKCGNDSTKMPDAEWIDNQRLTVDEKAAEPM